MPLRKVLRRAVPVVSLAAAAFASACADAARELPTASVAEAATLAKMPRRSLLGDITVTGISIETRQWIGSSPLPDDLSAASTFDALPTTVPGYTSPAVSLPNLGSNPPVLLDPVSGEQIAASGVRHPGSADTDIATRISISLNSNGPSTIAVRFGVDFLGGVVLLDGAPIGSHWDDPSWYGYWLSDERADNDPDPLWLTNPWGVIEVNPLELTSGPHVIEIIGFEDGNDFGTGGQIDVGSGWQDLNAPTPQRTLTVTKLGGAPGSVASAPAGISCGATCTFDYDYGTNVTLIASAPPGSVFAGWGGACGGTSSSCMVPMNVSQSVTAKFVGEVATTGLTMETRYWNRYGEQPTAGTAMALFNGLPTDHAGYTNEPVPVSGISNNAALFTAPNVGNNLDIGTRAVLSVTAAAAAEVRVVADGDFQAGGGLWLDGTQVVAAFGAVAPSLDVTVNLSPGPHTITVLGFEDCCDGGARLRMDFGTGLNDVVAPLPPPQTLTVTATTGGVVTSQPAGINCGASCSAPFLAGSQVTLTATTTAGFVFTGWGGGACTGTTPVCVVRMNQARTVSATFTPITHLLSVTKSGTGAGTVTSAPAGINCGTICAASFNQGSNVTLTATATVGSVFTGWTGACTGTGACIVPMSAAKAVNAQFTRLFALTVTKTGTGAGTVTSAPSGINCGTACSASFAEASNVVLTATPASNSTFTGWTGACAGASPTCTVPMDAAKTVTANFSVRTFVLSVVKAGTGSGLVSAPVAGINCGSLCTATLNSGTTVTLTATAATGSVFAGWSGAGCSGTGTCTVTMSQARTVTATFNLRPAGDTSPPTISCKATPDVLWPANHKMIDIRVSVVLSDAGSGPGGFKLLSVLSDEPDDAPEVSSNGRRRGWSENRSWRDDDNRSRRKKHTGSGHHSNDDDCGYDDDDDSDDDGDGSTVNDIQGWLLGTADVAGQLRAERAGGGDGRTYTLKYSGTDLAGNSAIAQCTVKVPHDMGGKKDDKKDKDDRDDDKKDRDDRDGRDGRDRRDGRRP